MNSPLGSWRSAWGTSLIAADAYGLLNFEVSAMETNCPCGGFVDRFLERFRRIEPPPKDMLDGTGWKKVRR